MDLLLNISGCFRSLNGLIHVVKSSFWVPVSWGSQMISFKIIKDKGENVFEFASRRCQAPHSYFFPWNIHSRVADRNARPLLREKSASSHWRKIDEFLEPVEHDPENLPRDISGDCWSLSAKDETTSFSPSLSCPVETLLTWSQNDAFSSRWRAGRGRTKIDAAEGPNNDMEGISHRRRGPRCEKPFMNSTSKALLL